ncbi:hypothetical protein QQ73_06075, partial [Candidatus Endoriftia persephone str. Guaymas]|nr:hypothetical protein [Candidatus Endoriftia persephone str. Guaymas]
MPPTESDSAPTKPFPGLSLPLELVLESLQLTDVHIIPPTTAEPILIEQVGLAARAVDDVVQIEHLEAAGFGARVELAGELQLAPLLPLNLELGWHYQLPEGPELSGQGQITGDLAELKLEQTLSAPLAAVLNASLYELQQAPRWDAKLTLNNTDLGAFAANFPTRVSGRLHSSGTPEVVTVDGRLRLTEPALGELNMDLAATYEDGTVTAERLLITTLAGSKLEGSGRYTTDDALGVFDAELAWSALRWPLTGERVQVRSNQGRLEIKGQPADYRYQLILDAILPDQPALTLEASGSGNTD